jgi:integrase
MGVTFESAAAAWLNHLQTRKRRPAKPATLKTFGNYVGAHIAPAIGPMELSEFSNPQMRDFVSLLAAKDLSPKTIHEITGAVKALIASVVDPQTGDPLYVRKWNAEFCDIPIVDPAAQRTPTLSKEQIEHALKNASELDRTLYALLAGAGLRIGEALAVKLTDDGGTFFDVAAATIRVRRSVWQGQEQEPKTPSAKRNVEIPQKFSEMLAQFVAGRTGYLFGNGLSLNESTARKKLNTVLPGCGFHSFRRFRATTLRAKRVPEDIIRVWLGHSAGSITDRYSKLGQDVEVRREWAEKVGLGFQLPKSKRRKARTAPRRLSRTTRSLNPIGGYVQWNLLSFVTPPHQRGKTVS